MAEWMPIAGGTVFIASGPSGDHLFVILFEPRHIQGNGPSEQILLVPFCSVQSGGRHDAACIVQVGDHDFIVHESYLDYRNSRIEAVGHIRARIAEGVIREHKPVTGALLRKIQLGLFNSTRVPRYVKDEFLS